MEQSLDILKSTKKYLIEIKREKKQVQIQLLVFMLGQEVYNTELSLIIIIIYKIFVKC